MKSKHKLMKRIFENQGMKVNFDSFGENVEEQVEENLEEFAAVAAAGEREETQSQYNRAICKYAALRNDLHDADRGGVMAQMLMHHSYDDMASDVEKAKKNALALAQKLYGADRDLLKTFDEDVDNAAKNEKCQGDAATHYNAKSK
jgi:hypothetical protein